MADNLTLKLKEELEKRHGKVVSEAEVQAFLQSKGLTGGPAPTPQSGVPQETSPVDPNIGVPPWEQQAQQEQLSASKGGALNALGVGLWSALDTAAFGIPGAFVEEEKFLDFEDPLAKYTGAVGGLAGFVVGGPMKLGAKAVQAIAAPIIRRTAVQVGKEAKHRVLKDVTSRMMGRASKYGVDRKVAKEIKGHYRKLAQKSQVDPYSAEKFSESATKLMQAYTTDARLAGKITAKEADSITKMFGDNFTKRPLQDFIGLMKSRGVFANNPRFARVASHAVNESLMFGLIDTAFEGVSTIEDHHFDWTAPLWGAGTGVVFSQLQWMNPVGKGAKWFQDFKTGVRASFTKPAPYKNWTNKQLKATSKFFGDVVENAPREVKEKMKKELGGASGVVTINHKGKTGTISLTSDDIFKQLYKKFGKKEGRNALIGYLEKERRRWGPELIRAANKEGRQNLMKNWMRMAAGGVAFNFHTFADMFIHDTELGVHDILPHFLIGAFLQIGKNPSRFDLNSEKMNQLRTNIMALGVDKMGTMPSEIPSFRRTPNRFLQPDHKNSHPETLSEIERLGVYTENWEISQSPLSEGEVSVKIKGDAKFDRIFKAFEGEFSYERNLDNISVSDAKSLVKTFEKETGLKNLKEYDKYFDELGVVNSKKLKGDFPILLEKIRQGDVEGELEISVDKKDKYQTPEAVVISEEILLRAKQGKLDWIVDANGEKITDGEIAQKMLSEKMDGYSMVYASSFALGEAKAMPPGKNTITVTNETTVRNIFEALHTAEKKINDAYPSKMSYSDSFTFARSSAEVHSVIGKNMAIESAEMMRKIFSTKFDARGELISYMKEAGLLRGEFAEPLMIDNVDQIKIRWPEGTTDEARVREVDLKRILKMVHHIQRISAPFKRSPEKGEVKIDVDKIDRLVDFLADSGMRNIHEMSPWIYETTIDYIMKDAVARAEKLSLAEIKSFYMIEDMGMANFDLSLKGGNIGYEINLIDAKFSNQLGSNSRKDITDYNLFANKLIKKGDGLINEGPTVKMTSAHDIAKLAQRLPNYSGVDAQVSAQQALIEIIDQLPRGKNLSNHLGQYIIEGGAVDAVDWMKEFGILKHNKKRTSGFDINMKEFNKELQGRLLERIKLKTGFSEKYIQDMIAKEEQAAKSAMDERFVPDIDHNFDSNTFLEKYNIDGTDFSLKSKENKRDIIEELILSEGAPKRQRVPAADIIKQALKRLSVKNDKGEWIEFKDVPSQEKEYVKRKIAEDIQHILATTYGSIKVNTVKVENGNVVETESYQQDTRMHGYLTEVLNLPYVKVEKQAIVYEQFQDAIQRRFVDIFSKADNLPRYERERIEPQRERLVRQLNRKISSFGSDHPDGMFLFQISKDTQPIAIPKQSMENVHAEYSKFASWAAKNKTLGDVKKRIKEINDKIIDPEKNGAPTEYDYNVMLSQLIFRDMMGGRKKNSALVDFLNDVDVEKSMGRIKLYDSKNFIKMDRNLVHSMQTVYRNTFKDDRTYRALAKVMKQDGFGVAVWNDVDYANVKVETEKVLKNEGWSEKQITDYFDGVIGNAHENVSSFDSIAFVSEGQMRFSHATLGNNPNSKNPIKPVISSGGRSGQFLLGKTLFVYSKSLDKFFKTNPDVDILLASSGAKGYNKGTLKEGLDSSLINQPFNRINSNRPIGQQKIRRIPIDALGFKPEKDVPIKTAKESTSDFNYMNTVEQKAMYEQNYLEDVKQAVKSMKDLSVDPMRINSFMLQALGSEGMGIDPSTGGARHLSNLAKFSSMTADANPMSYSDQIVKNKIYNMFIGGILNGKRSYDKSVQARYGGQSPIIQVPDASYRLKPTIVDSKGIMKLRGEMMIGSHERSVPLKDIMNDGRDMMLVQGSKVIDPKEFFGSYETKREGKKYIWEDMLNEGIDLGQLHDIIDSGKRGAKPGKIYDVVVDMYEHPTLKSRDTKTKKVDRADVWVVDTLPEAEAQLESIKKGKGKGTNFADKITTYRDHYIVRHNRGDHKHIYIRGSEPEGLLADPQSREKGRPYVKYLEGGLGTGIYHKDLAIGVLTNRKPHTRPNDMAILALKGFLPSSYGRAALVNSLDIVNIFEGDYDADKVDYFYGSKKAMWDYSKRAAGLFVQGIDPTSLKQKSKFSWSDDAKQITEEIQNMSAGADISKKAIGVVQKIPRDLGYLNTISMKGDEDAALKTRFGNRRKPRILFFTPGPKGQEYRITVDFNNLDYFSRAALEAQFMIDMGGGTNVELMQDVRSWKPEFLFPSIDNSITPNRLQREGPGFIRDNIQNKNVSKRIRIFRKFDKEGNEAPLNQLEQSMITTMMNEYGKLLNVAGPKTFQQGNEQRATSYDNVYDAADSFFGFNKQLSNNLYYKLRYKKDRSGKPFWQDKQFEEMFAPKPGKYGPRLTLKQKKKGEKRKRDFYPTSDMFVDINAAGEQIKQNSLDVYEGKRGNILERSLRPMWDADIFQNRKFETKELNPSITGEMVGYMDDWYQQLRTGNLSEYSGSIDRMQSNIMKTIKDHNSGAFYLGRMKQSIAATQNRTDLPYRAQKAIIEKINTTIREVENTLSLLPDKYWKTRKKKDLQNFTFTPIEGKESKEAVIQYDTMASLKQYIAQPLSDAGKEHLQSIKDVRKLFYSNSNNLGDVLEYGKKSILKKEQLDFLRDMPTISTFEEIQYDMLAKGVKEFGRPFLLEFMSSPRNKWNIGIFQGRLVDMPYGKTTRFKKGYQFLTRMINERPELSKHKWNESDIKGAEQLLRIIQTTEANYERFYNKKFDMQNFADPNYRVNIGTKKDPVYFSLEHIRLPSFGKELEGISGDFEGIKWKRDSNRKTNGFNIMNDHLLSFYYDIAALSGNKEAFDKYMTTMNQLKADMISNRIIDPIKYLATRSTIERDLKRLASEVITDGKVDPASDNVNVQSLLRNPVYLINGGHNGVGFHRGMSLEEKPRYTFNKLKEIVKIRNELSEAKEKLGWKTERNRKVMKEYKENCRLTQ